MRRTGLTTEELRARVLDATLVQMRRHGFERGRLSRARRDPELYRSFDFAAAEDKPFVQAHRPEVFRKLEQLLATAGVGTGKDAGLAGLRAGSSSALRGKRQSCVRHETDSASLELLQDD